MLEAAMFLAGAVLFLCAVLFFMFVWQDRIALARKREAMAHEQRQLREQRVELDIREHELAVWQVTLEREHRQLEQAREEVRMLTVSKHADDTAQAPSLQVSVGVGGIPLEGGTPPTARSVSTTQKARSNKEPAVKP